MEALYISVYDDPLSLEPGTKAADLELLPAWRRAKVLAMRDTVHRAMGVRAFLMLGDMLRAHFGIEQDRGAGYVTAAALLLVHGDLQRIADALDAMGDTDRKKV